MKANPNIDNEFDLLDLIKHGDETAFAKIYHRYWTELYLSAYKRLPEKEVCQDIIQNIFTTLWLRRDTVEINNLSAYLHTAVKFQVLKRIAREPKMHTASDDFISKLISPLESDHIIIEKETKRMIELFINALPKKRKAIFIKHYFEGLSTANIAVSLNVSQKTVQNQLATGFNGLKVRLTHLFLVILIISSAS